MLVDRLRANGWQGEAEWAELHTMFAAVATRALKSLPRGSMRDDALAYGFQRFWQAVCRDRFRPDSKLFSVAFRCLQSAAGEVGRRRSADMRRFWTVGCG